MKRKLDRNISHLFHKSEINTKPNSKIIRTNKRVATLRNNNSNNSKNNSKIRNFNLLWMVQVV